MRARGVGAMREASQLCELVHAMIWRRSFFLSNAMEDVCRY